MYVEGGEHAFSVVDEMLAILKLQEGGQVLCVWLVFYYMIYFPCARADLISSSGQVSVDQCADR